LAFTRATTGTTQGTRKRSKTHTCDVGTTSRRLEHGKLSVVAALDIDICAVGSRRTGGLPTLFTVASYAVAVGWRLYWWAGVLLTGIVGAGMVAVAVAARGGGSAVLGVIGAAWVAIAVGGIGSARHLAWAVEVSAGAVTFIGPLLRLSVPPGEVLEARTARFAHPSRQRLQLITATHGVIRVGPAPWTTDLMTELSRVNPEIRLPGNKSD
jgi:hypothetical protein